MLSCVRENWVSSLEPARLSHLQVPPHSHPPFLALRLVVVVWQELVKGLGGLCRSGCGRMLSRNAVFFSFYLVGPVR